MDAQRADEVYPSSERMAPKNNLGFLARCIKSFPALSLAERETGQIYAHFSHGQLKWLSKEKFKDVLNDEAFGSALYCIIPNLPVVLDGCHVAGEEFVSSNSYNTIGRWGEAYWQEANTEGSQQEHEKAKFLLSSASSS